MNETKPKEIDLSAYGDVVKLMDERTGVSDSNFCGDFRNAFHWYGKIFTNVKFNKINFYISTLEKCKFINCIFEDCYTDMSQAEENVFEHCLFIRTELFDTTESSNNVYKDTIDNLGVNSDCSIEEKIEIIISRLVCRLLDKPSGEVLREVVKLSSKLEKPMEIAIRGGSFDDQNIIIPKMLEMSFIHCSFSNTSISTEYIQNVTMRDCNINNLEIAAMSISNLNMQKVIGRLKITADNIISLFCNGSAATGLKNVEIFLGE